MIVTDVMVLSAIIALVEAVKTRFPQVQGYYTPVLCAVLGAAAGLLHLGGLDVVQGIVVGLSATGVHTVSTVLAGTDTTPKK